MTAVATPDPSWRRSWDDQLHAFAEFGDFVSAALCGHSVRTSTLTEAEDGRRCLACLLILGGQLADQHGDPGAWRP